MVNPDPTLDIHMDEAEDEEEMEIEFTPVDNKKKARSPSPSNKKTPSVATPNPFEALSDDEDPIVITGKETVNLKKARTKSKSPGRRRKSKSPNPRVSKSKNKKDNELEAFLVNEAINQNKDLLKTMKPKKKSISSFFGVPPMPITNTEKSKKTEKELTAVNLLTEHSQSDVVPSELAENTHVAANFQDLQDDDSLEDTPQVTHNQVVAVSNSEPDPPSGTQITNWSVNSSDGNFLPSSLLKKHASKKGNNNQLSGSDSEYSSSSDNQDKTAGKNDFSTYKDTSEDEREISPEAKVFSPPTRPLTNRFLRKHNKKAYKNTTISQSLKQLTPTMRLVKYPIPEQTIPLSRKDTKTTNDNSSDRSQVNNRERTNTVEDYPENNLPEQYRISIRFGKVEKGMRNTPSPIMHLLFFLNSWATLDPDIHPVFNTGSNRGKICPAELFPNNPRETKNLIHTVYSRRGNRTCLQISVTLAGAIPFWDLFKDYSSLTALQDQDISVRKILLGIDHEATVGLLTEMQSTFHFRDVIEADARKTFNIGSHIPISIQERKIPLRPSSNIKDPKKFTSGLVMVTDLKFVEEVKSLCEFNGLDHAYIEKRVFIPWSSRLIPCQPDQTLDPETHYKLLARHDYKLQRLTQFGLSYLTSEDLAKEFPDHSHKGEVLTINSILDSILHTEFRYMIHSRTRNLKGNVIFNAYKNQLSNALKIGERLKEVLSQKISKEHLDTLYPISYNSLSFRFDRTIPVNQISFTPRSTPLNYVEALTKELEEEEFSDSSSEKESTSSNPNREWDNPENPVFPKPGGVSSNRSYYSGNSTLRSYPTQYSEKNSPNTELNTPQNSVIPENFQQTVQAITERLATLEQSYSDIKEQLSKQQQALEDQNVRSVNTENIITNFITTFSGPLAKLLNIEQTAATNTNNSQSSLLVSTMTDERPNKPPQPPKISITQSASPCPGQNRADKK